MEDDQPPQMKGLLFLLWSELLDVSNGLWCPKHLQSSPPHSVEFCSWIDSNLTSTVNPQQRRNHFTFKLNRLVTVWVVLVNSDFCEDSSTCSGDAPAAFFYFLSSRWPFCPAVVLVDIQVFREALWALLPATYWNVCYEVAGIWVVNKVLNISFFNLLFM